MKGSRVQAIIRELRGEKIDIIEHSDDLVTFAQSALAPAKITRVSVKHEDDGIPHLDVIVEDAQLSLAIGKRGQNVRLAAELIGCKIDIKSESAVKDEVADALAALLHVGEERVGGARPSTSPRRPASTRRRRSGCARPATATPSALLDASLEDLAADRRRRRRDGGRLREWAQGQIPRRGGGVGRRPRLRRARGARREGHQDDGRRRLHGRAVARLPGPRRHPRRGRGGRRPEAAEAETEKQG